MQPTFWSTSSFGDVNPRSDTELQALREHVLHCRSVRGRWFRLRCMADAMDSFVAPRFFTTVFVAAMLLSVGALVA